jgi:2-polyprenyl-6-methoxyphenol hydroxylase-like FAD-dependent oxidoreductase
MSRTGPVAEVAVAGGGIGGLAAALAVAAGGHRVTVLERKPDFTELGAGIQLAPNGFHALNCLGVGSVVRRDSVRIAELRLLDGPTGEVIARMPLDDEFRRRFGQPYAVIRRNDLLDALLTACREHPLVTLRASAAVSEYRRTTSGVVVILADRTELAAAALVGADGLRSVLRRRVVGDGEPRVSGHTIYRTVLPMDSVPEELRANVAVLWAGPRRHVVHYPVSGGRYLNLAATVDNAARHAVVGVPVGKSEVDEKFAGMAADCRRLLAAGRDWRSWVLCDRDPVPSWTDGPVVLLGDAAHPMVQYAAQGACMALEDAVMLGRSIGSGDVDFAAAFRRFVVQRLPRTARAQQVSRWMGERIYHPAGADAEARTRLFAEMATADIYDRVAWLYRGFDAPDPYASAGLPRPATP